MRWFAHIRNIYVTTYHIHIWAGLTPSQQDCNLITFNLAAEVITIQLLTAYS